MFIHSLDIALNESDLNSVIKKHVPTTGKISNIRADLQDDHLVFSGHIQLLLSVKFEAVFEVFFTSFEIIARLIAVHPMKALAEGLKPKILKKIVEVADFAALDAEDSSIRIPIDALLSHYGLDSHLSIQDLAISENLLVLKLHGSITL